MIRHGSNTSRRANIALPARTPLAPVISPAARTAIAGPGAGQHQSRIHTLKAVPPSAIPPPGNHHARLAPAQNPKTP